MWMLDFETQSAVDLGKCGVDVYASHPSTEVLCAASCENEGPIEIWKVGESAPIDLLMAVASGEMIVCHNVAFELAIWNQVCVPKYGWPPLKPEQCLCTMTMCYAMNLPGALADAAPALGLEIQKDSAGHRVMMQLSQPREIKEEIITWWTKEEFPEKFEILYRYCIQDVEVERAIFKRVMRLSPKEFQIWVLDQKINARGVQVDLVAVKTAIELVEAEKERLNAEMKIASGGGIGTFTAVGQIQGYLKLHGIETESIDKASILELLERKLPEDVRRVLEIRREGSKASTAKLEAMIKGVSKDGRLKGMFQYHGAGATGRFSGRRVMLHNLPRQKISQMDIEEVFGLLRSAS